LLKDILGLPIRKAVGVDRPRPFKYHTNKKPWALWKQAHGFLSLCLYAGPGGLTSARELDHHQFVKVLRESFSVNRLIIHTIRREKNFVKEKFESPRFDRIRHIITFLAIHFALLIQNPEIEQYVQEQAFRTKVSLGNRCLLAILFPVP
jgi:hypothetical protein